MRDLAQRADRGIEAKNRLTGLIDVLRDLRKLTRRHEALIDDEGGHGEEVWIGVEAIAICGMAGEHGVDRAVKVVGESPAKCITAQIEPGICLFNPMDIQSPRGTPVAGIKPRLGVPGVEIHRAFDGCIVYWSKVLRREADEFAVVSDERFGVDGPVAAAKLDILPCRRSDHYALGRLLGRVAAD